MAEKLLAKLTYPGWFGKMVAGETNERLLPFEVIHRSA